MGASATVKRRMKQLRVAARNPHLAVRRLRGRSIVGIDAAEIAPHLPADPVIVEAGAYDGGDTRHLVQQWPGATVYAFEPVPELFRQVVANTRGLPQVHPQQLALGDRDGSLTMHLSSMRDRPGAVSGSSSLLEPLEHLREFPHVEFTATATVPVVTLDSWAEAAGVGRVDFCWLDLQGMELAVLRASPRILAGVSAVCMEVNRVELYAGAPTHREVLAWMQAQGFRVAVDRTAATYGNVLFVRHG